MAVEKYVTGNNKCEYALEDLVYTKDDFIVITGTTSVRGNSNTGKAIAFPEGFNINNTIILSAMFTKDETLKTFQVSTDTTDESTTVTIDPDFGIMVTIWNRTSYTTTYAYKVILMKIGE